VVSATTGAPIKVTGARIQGFAATTRRKEVSASHLSFAPFFRYAAQATSECAAGLSSNDAGGLVQWKP
jgi:hypothetical protein